MRILPAFLVLALLAGTALAYLPSGGDDDDPQSTMSIGLAVSCEGATVKVLDGDGNPVMGAHISVKDTSDATLLETGDTDSEGLFSFTQCGRKVDIKATHGDFPTAVLTSDLFPCGPCPECATDDDCPDAEYCDAGFCAPVPCGCGAVESHMCDEYECCVDADCPEGMSCISHECESPEVPGTPGCTEDADCADSQYCSIAAAAPSGICRDVSGCGYAANHSLVAYRCGNAPDCPICPEGYVCVQNDCVQGNISCPGNAFVGGQSECNATSGGEPCSGCDYEVTGPDGKNSSGKAADDGTFSLAFGKPGEYRVSLLRNGTILKTIAIAAFPRASEAGSDTAAMGPDLLSIALLLVLLLILAFAVFYWRGARGGKPKKG